jgi:uncharacterized protein
MAEKNTYYRMNLRNQSDSRVALYDPMNSDLIWEDDGKPISLEPVGIWHQPKHESTWEKFYAVSPDNPGSKSRKIRVLKIQIGLGCNYNCQYCNQGVDKIKLKDQSEDLSLFLNGISNWFDGGEDGKGSKVKFELWGGEPLMYWSTLKPLVEELKTRYPNARYSMVSNLTLLDEEKIDWIDQTGLDIAMSHDGPEYSKNRGTDPLENPIKLKNIKELYTRLYPKKRMSFNCVLTKNNFSLYKIRSYIAQKLEWDENQINMSTEEILLPYDKGGLALSPTNETEHKKLLNESFWNGVRGDTRSTHVLKTKIDQFFQSISQKRPAWTLGQKCGMDSPDYLAVNLKGEALTCQNTSSSNGHKIGHVEDFNNIKLNTAYHWSKRKECANCPVVQLCQGACLFLKDDLWESACDSSFTWNLSLLAQSMFFLTGRIMTEIEAPVLRRPGLPNKISVIELAPLTKNPDNISQGIHI